MEQGSAAARLPDVKVPAWWTFLGLAAGLAAGFLVQFLPSRDAVLAVAQPIGAMWLRALQMTILPLVAGLLFTGIVQTIAAARAGAMARRTIGLFALVLLSGTVTAAVMIPALLRLAPIPREAAQALAATAAGGGSRLPSLGDFLDSLVPSNVFAAAAGDAMLPLILFVSLFAIASTRLAEAPRRALALLFEAIAGAMIVVIGWVLALAPVGVFALALAVAAKSGAAVAGALAHYIVVVASVGFVVMLGAYAIAVLGGGQRPDAFARAVLPAQTVALSTQSSLASLPAMLAACRRLGLRQASADFVLPLAVVLLRATSPAMNLAVAIYVARLTGTPLPPQMVVVGIAVAMVMALSSPSLPGTISFVTSIGPIALAMGVPLEPLALLVAVEMLPDIMRTVGNVTMDVALVAVVDRAEQPSSSPKDET